MQVFEPTWLTAPSLSSGGGLVVTLRVLVPEQQTDRLRATAGPAPETPARLGRWSHPAHKGRKINPMRGPLAASPLDSSDLGCRTAGTPLRRPRTPRSTNGFRVTSTDSKGTLCKTPEATQLLHVRTKNTVSQAASGVSALRGLWLRHGLRYDDVETAVTIARLDRSHPSPRSPSQCSSFVSGCLGKVAVGT